jgi:hypothetical protein
MTIYPGIGAAVGYRRRPRQAARSIHLTLPAWWREVVLLGALYGAYELSRSFTDASFGRAVVNGDRIVRWEDAVHLSPEHLLNNAIYQATVLAVAASYFYSVMHYVVTPIVLIWMYRRHREHYWFARTTIVASTALALVGYYLIPTAPPRLLPGGGYHDVLAESSKWGWWGGEGSVPRGMGGLSDQFAAVPSMHVGWALWSGVLIAMYAKRRWVRWAGIAYPVVTTMVVLSTGNHYLFDAVAGALTMAVGVLLTAAIRRMANAVHGRRAESAAAATADHASVGESAGEPALSSGSGIRLMASCRAAHAARAGRVVAQRRPPREAAPLPDESAPTPPPLRVLTDRHPASSANPARASRGSSAAATGSRSSASSAEGPHLVRTRPHRGPHATGRRPRGGTGSTRPSRSG